MTDGKSLFCADGHVFENDAEIFEYLRPPFQGRKELLRRDLFPSGDNWNRTALSIIGQYQEGSTAERGGGERGERGTAGQWLEFLDRAGIEGTVLFSTGGLGFGQLREPQWASALANAYNTWLYEKFLKVTPRLHGMALLPVQNVPDAVNELRRCVNELGMVGALLVAGHRRPLGDSYYYPIYEAAQELETVLAVHAGGPGNRLDQFDRAIEARCLGHPTSQMIELTSLMFSGVFDRFPRLRFAFYEAGVAWAMFLIERIQEAYEQWGVQAPDLKLAPKEHLTSGRIYFHAELDEEILPYAVQQLGDEVLLYASDYPHLAPVKILHTLEQFKQRRDISDESKARILGQNARRLYRLPAAAPQPTMAAAGAR